MDIYDNVMQEFSSLASKKDKTIFQKFSEAYRNNDGKGGVSIKSEDEAIVYGVCRTPATFGAISQCLKNNVDLTQINSVADIGSGTGAGLLALSCLGYHKEYISFEKYEAMAKAFGITRKVIEAEEDKPQITAVQSDLFNIKADKVYDLVMCNYVLNELVEQKKEEAFKSLLGLSAGLVLVIEAGTPRGHADILKYKEISQNLGYKIVAPCKFFGGCPLQKNDWCHFIARTNRPSIMSKFKEFDRGFEDEKFIYLLVDKRKSASEENEGQRIIKRPVQNKGNVAFECCTSRGVSSKIISKKEGEKYKRARNLRIGDCL